MSFGAAVDVLRVTVNVGNSLGSSGIETNLPLSMTIGTGYVGRSSVGENLQPKHLVQWTRLAYNSDKAVEFPSFFGLNPWETPVGPVPAYPVCRPRLPANHCRWSQLLYARKSAASWLKSSSGTRKANYGTAPFFYLS